MSTSKNYTKSIFIEQLSKKTGFSKNISKKLINDLLKILTQNLLEGKFVLKNFGVFKIIQKKQRIGRNPKTKEEFIINARKSLTFSASKKISNFLN
ncbi:HU family DNA-binding protein [Pelagibacteraceae bacterium]|jgi:integration host factor subunit alpha|nr:HU family DNA-binding protein [Pelagibacteraceae bacterium]